MERRTNLIVQRDYCSPQNSDDERDFDENIEVFGDVHLLCTKVKPEPQWMDCQVKGTLQVSKVTYFDVFSHEFTIPPVYRLSIVENGQKLFEAELPLNLQLEFSSNLVAIKSIRGQYWGFHHKSDTLALRLQTI